MLGRVYISGPISNEDYEAQKVKFKNVQRVFEASGFEVFNPMENGLPVEATTAEHMRRDLATLTREENPFDTIYMMERWTHSKVCKVEFDVATAMGMEVIFEDVAKTLGEEYWAHVPVKFK